ncbi:DUF2339 domain-containing protein, partial [Mesorhizobium sp. M7A.T.Ca.TU.009.01.1.2]
MFESLIGLVAIIALFVIISRQQSRIGLVERELGALRSLVLSGAVPPAARPSEQAVADNAPADMAPDAAAAADIVPPEVSAAVTVPAPATDTEDSTGEIVSGPWTAAEPAPKAVDPAELPGA